MKILHRNKFIPIWLAIGDSIRFTWIDNKSGKEIVFADHTVTTDYAATFDEAIVFESEFEGKRTLGTMIVEKKD